MLSTWFIEIRWLLRKGHKISLYQHPSPYFVNGDSNGNYLGKYMLIRHPKKRVMISKKAAQIFVDKHIQQQQEKEEAFTVISLDESFFFSFVTLL